MKNVTISGPRVSTTCETQCQAADEDEVVSRMRADGWKPTQREPHDWGTVTVYWVRDTHVLDKEAARLWGLLR